jgi:hypothetical protein
MQLKGMLKATGDLAEAAVSCSSGNLRVLGHFVLADESVISEQFGATMSNRLPSKQMWCAECTPKVRLAKQGTHTLNFLATGCTLNFA